MVTKYGYMSSENDITKSVQRPYNGIRLLFDDGPAELWTREFLTRKRNGFFVFPSCIWPNAAATAYPLASVCKWYGRPISGSANTGGEQSFCCNVKKARSCSSRHSMELENRLFVRSVRGLATSGTVECIHGSTLLPPATVLTHA